MWTTLFSCFVLSTRARNLPLRSRKILIVHLHFISPHTLLEGSPAYFFSFLLSQPKTDSRIYVSCCFLDSSFAFVFLHLIALLLPIIELFEKPQYAAHSSSHASALAYSLFFPTTFPWVAKKQQQQQQPQRGYGSEIGGGKLIIDAILPYFASRRGRKNINTFATHIHGTRTRHTSAEEPSTEPVAWKSLNSVSFSQIICTSSDQHRKPCGLLGPSPPHTTQCPKKKEPNSAHFGFLGRNSPFIQTHSEARARRQGRPRLFSNTSTKQNEKKST